MSPASFQRLGVLLILAAIAGGFGGWARDSVLVVPQAAKMLGVGDAVVRRWKAEGHLRGYDYPPTRDKAGNIIRRGIMRIDLASVRELLARASRTSVQLRSEAARVPGAWSRRGASCN